MKGSSLTNSIDDPNRDKELIRKASDGDQSAFEELVTRHEERVYRLALSILRRHEEARDVAQDVFLALWENPSSYRPTAEFSTWLYRVTMNRSLSRLRLKRLKTLFAFADNDPTETAETPFEEQPDHQLEDSELKRQLKIELQNLPPRQRAALHLRYEEGLSVASVAESLGVSLKSAESLIFRAKQTIRQKLKQFS